jgi:predicted esterase
LFIQLSAFSQMVAKTIPCPAAPEGLIGFLQFTPSDYNNGQKHPLIVFMHGAGERGNGVSTIGSVAANGIPNLIQNGATMRFTVNGVTSSFVVLCPQLSTYCGTWPAYYTKNMIAYAKANLQIDTDRIYVTGLSLGGGGSWVYAFDSLKNDLNIAALGVMSGTDDGNDANVCQTAATAHLPIWAFHCEDDPQVLYYNLNHIQGYLTACAGNNNPAPRFTYYKTGGHAGGWNNGYDTGHTTHLVDSSQMGGTGPASCSFTPTQNLYEWFLSNKRAMPVAVVDALPVVTTTTTNFDASASYSPTGPIASYAWSQTAGPTSASIVGAATPVVSNLATGLYTFSLSITDILGATASTTTTVNVSAAAALPVTWVYFRGQGNGASNLLQWETASEQNTSYFAVERSADGVSYATIGQVAAAGNSTLAKDYSFTDVNPPSGNAYYRLREMDADAQYKLSDVVLISGGNAKTIEQIYPNPVHDLLSVVLNNASKGSGRIVVYDLAGRAMQEASIDKTQDIYSTSLNMKNLVPGLYLVEVKVGDAYKVMQRILKQ